MTASLDKKLKAASGANWRLSSCYQLRDGRYTVYLTYDGAGTRHYASQTGSGITLTAAFDAAWLNVEAATDQPSARTTEALITAVQRLRDAVVKCNGT